LGGGIETRLADIEKRLAVLEKFLNIIELKDASEEVKQANNFIGAFGQDNTNNFGNMVVLKGITNPAIGSIFYLDQITINLPYGGSYTFNAGYYKVLKSASFGGSTTYVVLAYAANDGISAGYLEYIDESYVVTNSVN